MKAKRHKLLMVICDWNGTLLDDLGLVYASVLEIFSTYGISPPSLADYQAEITSDFMRFYHGHGIPSGATAQDLNAIRKQFFEKRWDDVRLHRNADEFLVLLEQLHLITGIVSAEVDTVLKKRLEQFNIFRYFDRVIGNAWDKERALKEMLETFHFLPEEVAYVDDTFDGLMAARNVGILPIGVTHGYNTPGRIFAAQPDERYVARSFSDLKRIVEHEARKGRR